MLLTNTTFDSHLVLLKDTFEKIRQSGMTLKFSKCKLICSKIKFLGHIVSPAHICMDPDKVEAIAAFSYPRNIKELQSYIGCCNFYRKFFDRHTSQMSPLINLFKNKS